MIENIIQGKIFKLGNDIDTDQIYPGRYLYLTSPNEIAEHAMEDVVPDFFKKIAGENRIIVAGKNFGCGTSREHAPRALLFARVKAIVAESFGRIFYRNAIKVGLPVIKLRGIIKKIKQNDTIKIDLHTGIIYVTQLKKEYSFEKYPKQILSILKSGGLIAYMKKYKSYYN